METSARAPGRRLIFARRRQFRSADRSEERRASVYSAPPIEQSPDAKFENIFASTEMIPKLIPVEMLLDNSVGRLRRARLIQPSAPPCLRLCSFNYGIVV